MSVGRIANAGSIGTVAALVCGFWWQGERFFASNGPTFDEMAHIVAGYGYWTNGQFRLGAENPPVLKLYWTIPLVMSQGVAFPQELAVTTNDHWLAGKSLCYDSGLSYDQWLTPARRMNLVLGCGVVILSGWWAFRFWGTQLAGIAASAFAAFDPNLLAVSCIANNDAGTAFFSLLSAYSFWEYSRSSTRGWLITVGASLGLLLGSKFSALAMLGGLFFAAAIWVIIGNVLALPGTPTPANGWEKGLRLRALVDLAARVLVIGFIVLAATYAFIHVDEMGRGLKFQFTRTQHSKDPFFLLGERSTTGWYHYFVIAMLLKTPLGLLVGTLGALALIRPGVTGRMVWLVVPPTVYFVGLSYSRIDLGIRVALPAIVFLYVLAARLASIGPGRVWRLVLLSGCLGWSAWAAWTAGPWQLSYFNELAGGPDGGRRYLADSNLDWGQGLPALRTYMEQERIAVVYLAYFGTDRPESQGIRYYPLPSCGRIGLMGGEPMPTEPERCVVAVSINLLLGLYLENPDTFAWLRDRPPTAIVAQSILVFDITNDPVARGRLQHVWLSPPVE